MSTQELGGPGNGSVQALTVPGKKQAIAGLQAMAQLLTMLCGFQYYFRVCCMWKNINQGECLG